MLVKGKFVGGVVEGFEVSAKPVREAGVNALHGLSKISPTECSAAATGIVRNYHCKPLVLGAGGWYLLIHAYARAEAQQLAPLEFTALIWSTATGFFLFHETPPPQLFAGAALIVAACLFAAAERKHVPAPETTLGD